ncbi:hypothetical protein JCM11491_006108 [Sporobolomyces phaffii]
MSTATPPLTPTRRLGLGMMDPEVQRPPTPAPSPPPPPPPAPLDSLTSLVESLRREVNALPARERQLVLTYLVRDSSPAALSPLVHLILPRLKRDFLKTLPVELAFHVLSFVDDVKTLARAAAVSRFWRALLEDDATWKRMCWRSGFGQAPVPNKNKMRTLEFGDHDPEYDDDDRYSTPAGRERRGTLDRAALSEFAARAELFDLPPVTHTHSSDRARAREGSWSDAPPPPPSSSRRASAAAPEHHHTGLGFAPSVVVTPRRRASAFESTAVDLASTLPRHQQPRQFSLPAPTSTSTLVSPPMFSLPTTTTTAAAIEPTSTAMYAPLPTSSTTLSSSTPTPRAPPSPPPPDRRTAPLAPAPGPGRPVLMNPFSYKTHFKRAYLTESNWLRGPGRLLSTQMSADDGVVTSLGFDREWIVVGMATSKVHVFDAAEGRYVRTLEGHDLGVWCLTLVSKGGGGSTTTTTSGTGKGRATDHQDDDNDDEVGDDGAAASWTMRNGAEEFAAHGRSTTTSFSSPRPSQAQAAAAARARAAPRRRRSFPSVSVPSSPSPSRWHDDSSDDPSSGAAPDARTGGGGMGLGAGGRTGDSAQQAGVCSTARGWGRDGAVVVSGGCDRDVRVWDVESGECLHTLRGHTSTVRCMRVLDGRPIAVSGSRDSTLRVWDLDRGECVHLLSGHEHSVRCIEVSGNKVVSGSYDATCRLWDVDTGQCLHVFRGHIHQIYAVAFDGIRVVTGSLDSTVRIWSAETGEFLALLQGHTSLVGQLVLVPGSGSGSGSSSSSGGESHHTPATLVTGGSDGRVIVFDLETFDTRHRLCAHDNSVTCLQVDDRFIVTGGNDGRIKLWDLRTGQFVRELIDPCGAVWRVVFRDDKCVTLCRRDGKTLMDVRTFRPSEEELFGDASHHHHHHHSHSGPAQ